MIKTALAYLRALVVSCLLIFLLLIAFVSPVHAGKAMAALAFDSSSEVIEVVSIYKTAYATQKTLMKSLKVTNKPLKKALGFKGFSLLQSQDGKQIITLAQWSDLESYQAYMPTASATSKSPSPDVAVTPPEPNQTLIFRIVSAQTSTLGATPALRGKEAVVRLTQLTPKNPEGRSQVLVNAEQMMASIVQNQPIPQSVILLDSLNNGDVTILTNWNCSALFEDVGKPQAIALSSDLTELVDSKQTIYNVTAIIPSEVKKDKSK